MERTNCASNLAFSSSADLEVSSTENNQVKKKARVMENRAGFLYGNGAEPLAVRIPDAVRMTGIGRSKLYELIASGDLDTIKVGRCTLVPMESLRALLGKARMAPGGSIGR